MQPQSLGTVVEEREERLCDLEAGEDESRWNSVFQTWQESCTPELRATVGAYIRPVRDQASEHPSLGWGGTHEPHSWLRDFLGKENQFSLKA